MNQNTNWCVTVNNYDDDDVEWFKSGGLGLLKCAVWQFEKAPTTKTPHIQGYVEFKKKIRLGALKIILPKAHWEMRKGTRSEAIKYCEEEETRIDGPFYFGKIQSEQGKRNDIEAFRDAILDEDDDLKLVMEYPSQVARFPKFVGTVRNAKKSKEKKRPPKVTVLWGEPGVGKTKYVYDVAETDEIHSVMQPTNGQLWFDGYTGQETVLFDDFTGWIQFHMLLKIVDMYPIRVPIKGTTFCFNPKFIYFTSNTHPDSWYKYDESKQWAALKRRIHRCGQVTLSESGVRDVDWEWDGNPVGWYEELSDSD